MDNHQHNGPNENQKAESAFMPPRHWIGPEELDASYWNDPQVREKRAQEFYEKPVEWLEKIDKIDKKGLARREFLTVMGASMAMASFACVRRPVHKIIPYVVKPEDVTPGVANYYASTCQECSAKCGILIKTREGRPIKLEGNPEHPINQGALCSSGQASLLNLYDPDRLTAPLSKLRSEKIRKEKTWADVDPAITSRLKNIASQGGKIRILTEPLQSDTTRRLIQEFLSSFPQGKHVEFDPLELSEISEAQELSYGTAVVPHYLFDQAELIVSLGSDFLESWLSPVEYARGWSKNRKLIGENSSHAKLSKLVCFESILSVTGASADQRYPIRPGDELKIALALAHEIIVKQKRSRFANDAQVLSVLAHYTSEKVATEIGLEGGSSSIQHLADDLWNHRGKSILVGGGIHSKTPDALALQVAVNLLNSALENEGSTIDGTLNTSPSSGGFGPIAQLISDMKSGAVDALMIWQSNPVYTLPRQLLKIEEALKKVPFVIVASEREDETGHLADYVLPIHHYLENWGDAHPRKGLYSLQQPAVAPLHSSRAFQDMLITWAHSAGFGGSQLISRAKDWHDYLQSNWKETVYRESQSTGSFDQFWETVLRTGVLNTHLAQKGKPTVRLFKTTALSKIPSYMPLSGSLVNLALYEMPKMQDGRSANNAWIQELPDPISSITWDNFLNISPALAKRLEVKTDDVVELTSGDLKIQVPVNVQVGMHPQVASVAVGFGRWAVGKVGNEAGVDVFPWVEIKNNQLIYAGRSVQIRKTGKFYRLAAVQWHNATEDRPIINDITLAQYRKNPSSAQHTNPHLRLETVPTIWPKHEYKGHRWGMAIDLNACTGCGACMVACQAENNVPVVGRDQVRVSRVMHWIRIDRYYSGPVENPSVIFQPMLCQHCENAPCETVCPVLATVHDDEGLNVQVYNRCVGTRYCQNNCPYKVRRFNFFDHWKFYEGTMNLAWNPDVTVRTRGIMEKCTFCVQRIRDAKEKAKDAGDRVRDGDFQVACQQTCSTGALVFGDMNDPESRVAKLMADPRAFRVLEVINTQPSISYLTKVRNKVGEAHSGAEGEKHE